MTMPFSSSSWWEKDDWSGCDHDLIQLQATVAQVSVLFNFR